MNRLNYPGRYWGPGLIIVALLMVLIGYLGAPKIEKMKYRKEYEFSSADRTELHRIWRIRHRQLIADLNRIGPQDFRVDTGSNATFDLIVSPELDDLMASSVGELASEVTGRFPDRRYIVRASIFFSGSAMHFIVEQPAWHVMSGDLPESAYLAPESYDLEFEDGAGVPILIPFMYPGDLDEEERRQAWRTLDTIFSDSRLTTLDVAGNPYPVGVQGQVRLAAYLDGNPVPLKGYAIALWIVNRMGTLGLLLLLIAPPVWVFLDARRRRLPAVLWGLFTLPTSFLGALIYALGTRESGPACPECGERVSARFVVCPYCQTGLKGTCPTCGQTVGLGWHYCPSCAAEL
jgi:hypothetical protein